MFKRVAVLSDIHGNSWALRVILDYIDNHSFDLVINLGDIFYGPLDPVGTWELIRSRDFITLRGNEDLILNESYPVRLPDEIVTLISGLPLSRVIDSRIFCFHGKPEDPAQYFVEKVLLNNSLKPRPEDQLINDLQMYPYPLILCGHSHIPRIIELPDTILVNPGSVGCPAFEDDNPYYHKVENDSPHARFAIIEMSGNEIRPQLIRMEYDWESAARCADENKRPDWAEWLRTGRVNRQ